MYASTNQRANSFIPPTARKVFITVCLLFALLTIGGGGGGGDNITSGASVVDD